MTPAQVAHIMSLVDDYAAACFNFSVHGPQQGAARAAVEAALRDAPQAEPVVSHEREDTGVASQKSANMSDKPQQDEGWVMVPINPTREMRIAGGFESASCWDNMLAARPSAPQQAEGWKLVRETPREVAERLYAEHPTFRGTKAIPWRDAPNEVKREWLDKANAMLAARPSAPTAVEPDERATHHDDPELTPAAFADRLARHMQIASLTAKEVSELTGVSETTLSRLKNHGRMPDAISYAALCNFMGWHPHIKHRLSARASKGTPL